MHCSYLQPVHMDGCTRGTMCSGYDPISHAHGTPYQLPLCLAMLSNHYPCVLCLQMRAVMCSLWTTQGSSPFSTGV